MPMGIIDGGEVLKDIVPIAVGGHDVLNIIMFSILMIVIVIVYVSVVLDLVWMLMQVMMVLIAIIIMTMRTPAYVLLLILIPTGTSHVFFLLLQRGRHVAGFMIEPLDDAL